MQAAAFSRPAHSNLLTLPLSPHHARRYLLEEMVPELEALEGRGYFSRQEIRAIVQKRQDYEYALKRMAAVRVDYLRYIEYEERLEELRVARRASRGISGKKGFAEFCIVRRIHFIYERATRKFRWVLGVGGCACARRLQQQRAVCRHQGLCCCSAARVSIA